MLDNHFLIKNLLDNYHNYIEIIYLLDNYFQIKYL